MGITSNIVSPGLIETDQNKHFPLEIKQHYAYLITIGRTGKPEDVAKVVGILSQPMMASILLVLIYQLMEDL